MLYQVIIAAGLVIFMLNLALNLRSLKKLRCDEKAPEPAPLISVLIPARDEELNIATCLESLQKQDYPNFEILVLDDNSSDNTATIVEQAVAKDSRIQLLRGAPLPEDWAGKPFACYQLAKQARGSWLLFVDADTTHAPHMLRSTLAQALRLNSSLLSGFPRQLATSLPQKIAVPVLYFIILSWLPLWWLQRSREPKPSLAIGQFLLFPSKEYWRIGGHEAVKSRILEDVWLGVEISRSGGRQVAVDLSPAVSCNMYHNVGAMWEGFIKWVYSVLALSPPALAMMMAAAYFFFLLPFYSLWRELFVVVAPSSLRAVIISQVAMILLMRWLVDNRFKEPFVSIFLHPVGLSFLFLASFCAVFRRAAGAGVRWKERLYSRESNVE
ncbi:MAG TPA: glycosyltransferase [Dehalococcoidales bacterium]|nr:glycosyltransferase [Dehalococcoidales bacterium]